MLTFVITGLIILFSAAVQGLTGFGNALVAMSLLPFVIDLRMAVPLVAVSAMIVNAFNFMATRAHFRIRDCLSMLAGALLGAPVGVLVLKCVDPSITKRALGAMLILYSLFSMMSKREEGVIELHTAWGALAGFFSGVFGGAFNLTGPPVVIYLSLKHEDKNRIKSLLAGYFLALGGVILVMFQFNGLFTSDVNRYCAPVVVFASVGALVGNHYYKKVNQTAFKKMIYLILLVSGALLLLK